jgi:acyl-CoA reductase-like NAD-dependent aldehyde dehydrogenase
LAGAARQLRVGQPLDRSTDVGAMIHAGHLDKVLGHVEKGRAQGARVVTGGGRAAGTDLGDGLYVEPTILDGVTPSMTAFTDEIFGPVLSVTRFSDVDEAVTLANAVEYGLSNSIWSKDIDKVLPISKQLKSGTVYVNTTIDGPPTMPFGGYKASGFGREMGQAGFEEFTELKSVSIRSGKRAGTFAIGGSHVATS